MQIETLVATDATSREWVAYVATATHLDSQMQGVGFAETKGSAHSQALRDLKERMKRYVPEMTR